MLIIFGVFVSIAFSVIIALQKENYFIFRFNYLIFSILQMLNSVNFCL